MVEARNLTKYYGRKRAVEGVSFTVDKGEIVGLLGPNAAGKTTLMKMLTCFLAPTSGTATVNGYNILENPEKVQESIGYLPEKNPLYEELTVDEFLNFVAETKGIVKKREKIEKISKISQQCGLDNVLKTGIYKLSKGYRQRVGIAQAIINDPPVLILDEPTIGLDPKQIIETRKLIKNLSGNRTVILSTHILPEVSMTCERVIIINEGKIVTTDTVENLTFKLKGSIEVEMEIEGKVGEVVKTIEEIEEVEKVEVEKPVKEKFNRYTVRLKKDTPEIKKKISNKIVGENFGLLEMKVKEMTLEDIFLKLVTEE
ncbi:ATP-binding cassette domain-containing protein [bacterium]|nr:ATP-binding cassette domain-containing protein [bacterium]